MLKILHFTHSFLPVYGGTTTRLIGLHRDDGNQHTMIVPYLGSRYVPRDVQSLQDQDLYDNILVRRVVLSDRKPGFSFIPEFWSRTRNWQQNAKELLSRVGEDGYQVIYGHNPMEFALAASRYSRIEKLPLIFEVHGLVRDSFYEPRNPLKGLYHRLGNARAGRLEANILRRARFIVVQTGRMKERLTREFRIGEERIQVVYNGVDIGQFEAGRRTTEAAAYRRENNLEDKTVMSYFGFLDDNNGIRFLLGALERIPSRIQGRLHVLVVGRGPYASLVRQFAESHPCLEYLGMVDYQKIPLYYEISDVFVIPRPSNLATETLLPMKLLEALAMKKIVLVSDVGGMTEVVRDGVNGFVFRRDDEADFFLKLFDILDDPKQNAGIAERARASVVEKYTWQESRFRLSCLYAKLA